MPPDQFQPDSASRPTPQPAPLRAAQYVRMSTEHQQYSTNNQADKILEYAQRRNIEIVRTYADEGKSGLSLGGRASLQKLIADVETGVADFTLVLVYDVSRWGRFQDADEAAFYEYKLKRKASWSPMWLSSLKTMARRSPPSSKVSSAPWRANTAGNSRPRCLQASAA